MRQLLGLGYMYAARTGAYDNPKRLQQVCVGALITAVGIYVYTGSGWWASIPLALFVFLMLMGALNGIRRFRRGKAAANAARSSNEYCMLRPEAASTPLPQWARGSGSGAYAWLIGLQSRAQTYVDAWPQVLSWDCVQQAGLADTMTQAWCSLEGEVDQELIAFSCHVHRPRSQEDLNALSDDQAMLLTRRVCNMAWCALYGPEDTRDACRQSMARLCGTPHGPPSVWDVLLRSSRRRRDHSHERRRGRRTSKHKHRHTSSPSSTSSSSAADTSYADGGGGGDGDDRSSGSNNTDDTGNSSGSEAETAGTSSSRVDKG